jgi:hypothetical protein
VSRHQFLEYERGTIGSIHEAVGEGNHVVMILSSVSLIAVVAAKEHDRARGLVDDRVQERLICPKRG